MKVMLDFNGREANLDLNQKEGKSGEPLNLMTVEESLSALTSNVVPPQVKGR
jgi:hypothetical protein